MCFASDALCAGRAICFEHALKDQREQLKGIKDLNTRRQFREKMLQEASSIRIQPAQGHDRCGFCCDRSRRQEGQRLCC